MKPKCKFSGCPTLLGRYSNPDYCHLHTKPAYDWNAEAFVMKLRGPGEPPLFHVTCDDCGRVHPRNRSCVCKATPAPKQPSWESFRPDRRAA